MGNLQKHRVSELRADTTRNLVCSRPHEPAADLQRRSVLHESLRKKTEPCIERDRFGAELGDGLGTGLYTCKLDQRRQRQEHL